METRRDSIIQRIMGNCKEVDRGFTGDVCVLVKVAPENFFAVPEYKR